MQIARASAAMVDIATFYCVWVDENGISVAFTGRRSVCRVAAFPGRTINKGKMRTALLNRGRNNSAMPPILLRCRIRMLSGLGAGLESRRLRSGAGKSRRADLSDFSSRR